MLRRLDIDSEQVALVPTEPAEILTRCFGGGAYEKFPRKKVFSYAEASQELVCQRFMAAVRSVKPDDLDYLSFEALCVKAAVSPLELLGAILMAAKSLKATESALKAILAHPDVIDTTVETAKLPGPAGYSDRRMLHEAVGFLPTRKGGGIEINFGFGRPAEERGENTDADEAWDESFPDMGSQIQTWSADKHKMLERGK